MTLPSGLLRHERSPYLRDHADDPVAWQPWSAATLEAAARLERPLFVSIGYAACHWCHVMHRESFGDAEVASLLNDLFVPVKVDREERPDVDAFFMGAARLLSGGGGWPLTVVATSGARPFWAGTYLPKEGRRGLPGLLDVLASVAVAWGDKRGEVERSADQVVAALAEEESCPAGPLPDGAQLRRMIEEAAGELAASFDQVNGGFGARPKFPMVPHLLFLLRHAGERGRRMADRSLRAMYEGGIRDHLAGGFHRYSTDERWHVPHFEKMLYDQALLTFAALEAYEAGLGEEHLEVARETLGYTTGLLRCDAGSFCAAEDADSEGEEGRFYRWREEDFLGCLEAQEGRLAALHFDVRPAGNWTDPASGVPGGDNVLRLAVSVGELAAREGLPTEQVREVLASARRKLRTARERRPRPRRDDKVLADWNGLMLAALARAHRISGEDRWREAAQDLLDHLMGNLHRKTLLHAAGVTEIPAFADDYAFMVMGILELHRATSGEGLLRVAAELTDEMLSRLGDPAGGVFLAADGPEGLPVRRKPAEDGALPSANGVAAANLLRLSILTGRSRFRERAAGAIAAFAGGAASRPSSFVSILDAAALLLGDGDYGRPRETNG